MNLSLTHIVSFVLTMLITILPGMVAARKIKSADDYNVGGRSAGVGLVAGSIIGTIVGGAATVGTAQLGFTLGLTAWWFTLGSGIALIIMGLFYAGSLRSSGLTTVSEFLVSNYGRAAGPFASLSASAGIFFSVVASTLTALHLVAGIFGVSLEISAAVILFFTIGMVFFGGISGAGMAGILKMALIFATIFVGGGLAYMDMGQWQGLQATFSDGPWFSLFGAGIEDGLFSLGAMIVGVISTQTYVQAIFSAKDSKTAAKGCITAAMIVIPIGLPSVMIGMFMHVNHPEISSIEALPLYMLLYLPDWLGGIGIATILLSALSSISGLSLGVGTMISRDLVKNVWKSATSVNLLWATRFSVVFVVLGAIAFVFAHLDSSVLEWNYLSMALRGSGIFLPLTFAVFFPDKVRGHYGVFAIAAGVFVGCLWKEMGISDMNSLFPALIINLCFLVPGFLLGKKQESAFEEADDED